MPRFLLIALNGPTAGNEDAYNDWYDNEHAIDLMRVDGARSVRRFKVEAANRTDRPYANVTEIEAESAEIVMQQLAERASTFPDSIDRDSSIFVLAREITQGG